MSSARARMPPSSRDETAPARARARTPDDDVAGAIANQRAGRTSKVRDHELASLAVGNRTLRAGLENFADVFRFVQMKRAGRLPALEADRPDFGEPVMVDHARSPSRLDPLPRRRNAAAGLSGHDQHAHRARGQIGLPAAHLARDLEQSKRVCRRAADDGGLQCLDHRRDVPGSTCRRPECSAPRSGSPPRTPSRSRETARTRTERKSDRARRRSRRRRQPSSTRASTASSRSCRATARGLPVVDDVWL